MLAGLERDELHFRVRRATETNAAQKWPLVEEPVRITVGVDLGIVGIRLECRIAIKARPRLRGPPPPTSVTPIPERSIGRGYLIDEGDTAGDADVAGFDRWSHIGLRCRP